MHYFLIKYNSLGDDLQNHDKFLSIAATFFHLNNPYKMSM